MDPEQEAIELFKALPEESQKRVCERLEQEELEETSRLVNDNYNVHRRQLQLRIGLSCV